MRSDDDRQIVRVVKKGDHGGHHGGAWKVAYADFVTALMAFFLVMWILGLNQDTRKAIAAYFNDPMGVSRMLGGGKSLPSSTHSDSAPQRPAAITMVNLIRRMEQARFTQAKKKLEQKLRKLPELKELLKYIEIKVTTEGLRVELLDGPSSTFFDTGSAHLKPRTVEILHVVASELKKLNQPVVIEGHTDRRPYLWNQQYGNWELSVDRANAARRAMAGELGPAGIAEVRGYADRMPRIPSDPYNYANRRVTILVPFSDRAGGSSVHTVKLVNGSPDRVEPIPPDLAPHLGGR